MFGIGGSEFTALLVVIAFLVFLVMAILMPFFVYAAQKWAYRSYKELIEVNEKLAHLNDLLENAVPDARTLNARTGRKP